MIKKDKDTRKLHTHADSYNMEKEEKINNENGERNRDRKKDVEYNEW